MPALAYIYILVVCFMVFGAVQEELGGREPVWRVALNFVAVAIMLFMFAGYWVRGWVEKLGLLAPCLLLLSLSWEICTAPGAIDRWIDRGPQKVAPEARLLAKRMAFGVELVLSGIGYCFGGVAALRGL